MSELMTDVEYNWTTEGEPCEGSTRGYLELATHYIPSENGSNYIFLHIENTKQHYTYSTYQVKIKPCSNYNCNHNLLQYNHDILHVDVCNCSFCFVFSRASADLVLAAWAVAIVVSPRVSGKLPGVTSDNEHVETKKFAKCEETSLASLNAFKF